MWLTKLIEGLLELLDLPISKRSRGRVARAVAALTLLFPVPAVIAARSYEMHNLAPATNLINVLNNQSTTTARRP